MTRRPTPAVALALVVLAGCGGDGRLPTYPVRGTVTFDGKPLPRAEVWLVPKDEAALKAEIMVRPYGVTEADGSFVASTYLTGDGAPAGEYAAIVHWSPTRGATDNADDAAAEAGSKGPRRPPFPAKYRTPATSGLTATVGPGPNQIALDLKAK